MAKPNGKSRKNEHPFDDEYAAFIDDLGGFLWHIRMITRKSFEALSYDLDLAPMTLRNLAERKTLNPQGRTIWKILKGLDNRNIIRHSMLEQYRTYTHKTFEVMREHG